MNFYPVLTEDGSISLYNTEINDIYHSKIGAYTESLEKFVLPSGILDFISCNNEVNILDSCSGLGYNSRIAVNEIIKTNPECNINITMVENDPFVVAFSACVNFNDINSEVNQHFNDAISSIINIEWYKDNLLPDVNFIEPFNKDSYISPYKNTQTNQIEALLHNIYYRTISDSNKIPEKIDYNSDRLNITILISDLRKAVLELNALYDCIFHDAFTPSKVPSLWSVELFKEYFRLLNNNGNLTTYSSSSSVRSGLLEAGFCIGCTEPVGRKMSGTIACKNKEFIYNNLSDYELGLLDTNSGIPYYDTDLKLSDKEILRHRASMQRNSSRTSTSSYLKKYRQSDYHLI